MSAARIAGRTFNAITDKVTVRRAMFGASGLAITLGGGKLVDSVSDAFHGPQPQASVVRIPGTDCLHITNPDGSTTLVGDCNAPQPVSDPHSGGSPAAAALNLGTIAVVGGIGLGALYFLRRK